jgi:hypothetical protein
VRTQIFAFIPFIILLVVVFSVADGRLRRRWLLLLAPLTALWANLHGTFVLAPVLVGLTGASLVAERWLETGEVERAELFGWGGATALVALAAMLNPRGAAIYAYVYKLTFVSEVSSTVTEWQPPDITTAYGAMVTLVLVSCLAILAIRRNKARLFEVVLFAATAYLASGAIRQMFWWAAMMLMVMPHHARGLLQLEPWWKSQTSRNQGVLHASLALLMAGCVLLSQPGLPVHRVGVEALGGSIRRSDPGRGLLGKLNPTRIVRGLKQLGYPGRIFHSQEIGGHLEYALATPQRRRVAFVDQRMELIPERIWDEYFGVSAANEGWRKVIEKYDIRTLLLKSSEQAGLIRAVQADPAWTLIAVDERHLLFFRSDQIAAITRWRSEPSGT